MQTEEIVLIRSAVAVTEDALRVLCERIERIAAEAEPNRISGTQPTVNYYGELSNGTEFTFETAQELLSYQNRPDRAISTLHISFRRNYGEEGVSVTVSGKAGTYVMKASSKGEVGEAFRIRQFLEDFKTEVQSPWRWMWWGMGNLIFGLMAAYFIWIYVWAAYFASDAQLATPPDPRGGAKLTVYLIGFVAILVALFQARRLFFPRVLFALGQGKARYERLRRWQWLPISAAAGLVAKIIYDTVAK